MRKTFISIIVFFTTSGGLLLSQDVLIEANGNKLIGLLISYRGDVQFVSIIDEKETILIYDWIDVKEIQLSDGRVINSADTTNRNPLFINNDLRPPWNFHQPKDPFKAGILSTIFPSGGHFYNERYGKGFLYLITVPLLYLAGVTGIENNTDDANDTGELLLISSIILHFYSVYDAIINSHNINKEYYRIYLEEEKTSKQQE